jgi:hypothetical protein
VLGVTSTRHARARGFPQALLGGLSLGICASAFYLLRGKILGCSGAVKWVSGHAPPGWMVMV